MLLVVYDQYSCFVLCIYENNSTTYKNRLFFSLKSNLYLFSVIFQII